MHASRRTPAHFTGHRWSIRLLVILLIWFFTCEIPLPVSHFGLCVADKMEVNFLPFSVLHLRPRVADYVIFLSTLYDIIFQWCSQTWYSHQNVSVEQDFYFFKSLNLLPWILMPWNGLILAHYVGRGPKWVQAHSLGALPTTLGQVHIHAWHLTQQSGQGLDHSIVLRLLAHDSNLCFVNYHICCGFLCIRSYLGLVTGLVITLLHKREFCSNWYVTLSALCPACTFNWKLVKCRGITWGFGAAFTIVWNHSTFCSG
jgi:hypothetical protein